MRSSEIQLRKLKLRLRDSALLTTRAPCRAIWQQPLQSVLALRSCSATDLILNFSYLDMLQQFIEPQLVASGILDTVVYQQDGAPAHFALIVRD